MKLKYTFETVELDGQIMAVPVGDGSEDLPAMIRLNETAAFCLKQLAEETDEAALLAAVEREYTGDPEEIRAAVLSFVRELKENGILA